MAISCVDWKKDVRSWEFESNNENNVNNSEIQEIPEKAEETNDALMTYEDNNEVNKAKIRELNNWKDFCVYQEVQNTGQNALSVRWVKTEKEVGGKMEVKERLVVRGFEEANNVQ